MPVQMVKLALRAGITAFDTGEQRVLQQKTLRHHWPTTDTSHMTVSTLSNIFRIALLVSASTIEPIMLQHRLAFTSSVVLIPAPHYHPSELVLGRALAHPSVRAEFPRESYKIITKTAKFGPKVKDHIYDPEVVRKSIERSLRRLKTDYLDVVCECS